MAKVLPYNCITVSGREYVENISNTTRDLLVNSPRIDIVRLDTYFNHFKKELLLTDPEYNSTELIRLFQILSEVMAINIGIDVIDGYLGEDILSEILHTELTEGVHTPYLCGISEQGVGLLDITNKLITYYLEHGYLSSIKPPASNMVPVPIRWLCSAGSIKLVIVWSNNEHTNH